MDTKCNNDDQINNITRYNDLRVPQYAFTSEFFSRCCLRIESFKYKQIHNFTHCFDIAFVCTMCLRTTPLSKQNLCSACNYVRIECVLRHTWPKNMLLRALLPPTIIHNFRIRFCLQFRFMVFVQCNFIQQDKENEKFHAIFFRVREKRARHLAQTKRAETNKIAHHKFTDHHEKTPVAAKQAPLA